MPVAKRVATLPKRLTRPANPLPTRTLPNLAEASRRRAGRVFPVIFSFRSKPADNERGRHRSIRGNTHARELVARRRREKPVAAGRNVHEAKERCTTILRHGSARNNWPSPPDGTEQLSPSSRPADFPLCGNNAQVSQIKSSR